MTEKTIVVTGGSKGIGKAIVHTFAGMGFRVLTCSRSGQDLEHLASEVGEQFPKADLEYIAADLSDRAGVDSFVQWVQKRVGAPDVLVNNTGVFLQGALYEEPDGQLETMIDTNLYSAYYVTRGLLKKMMEAKRGHIFNMCSTASIIPYLNGGSYCISKFALYGMSKVLREEMKPYGIRVTAILPGATLTPSWDGVDLPPERFIKPMDVAAAVKNAYQLSDNSVMEEILIRPQLGDL
jgi:NAD(P)-dependent dehydrogenase (short-subunit alcohol dehydrogenase family)